MAGPTTPTYARRVAITRDVLEADLLANWETAQLAVYADFLQSAGDPRGELIAIDLAGVDDRALRTQLEIAAADNVKRVRRPDTDDWTADPGLARIRSFLETKTVWHPIGV